MGEDDVNARFYYVLPDGTYQKVEKVIMNEIEFISEYEQAIAHLKAGEELTEKEIKTLIWDGYIIDEIEGETHRWYREVKTIIKIDSELYAIDWDRGLTALQENEYPNQPYRVVRKEKQITVTFTVTCYEREET